MVLPLEKYTKITEKGAELILKHDLEKFIKEYIACIKVDLKPNQHASLLSLMFNIGSNAFKNYTLLKLINSNSDIGDIKAQFLRWKYVGKIENKGLLNRRIKEWEVYSK